MSIFWGIFRCHGTDSAVAHDSLRWHTLSRKSHWHHVCSVWQGTYQMQKKVPVPFDRFSTAGVKQNMEGDHHSLSLTKMLTSNYIIHMIPFIQCVVRLYMMFHASCLFLMFCYFLEVFFSNELFSPRTTAAKRESSTHRRSRRRRAPPKSDSQPQQVRVTLRTLGNWKKTTTLDPKTTG